MNRASTDGWRGVGGAGWSERHLLGAVDTLCATIQPGRAVAFAYDGRGGAADLARLAADRAAAQGRRTLLAAQVTPTPVAGHFARATPEVGAAVIVTASHNPPGHIGVKIRSGDGYPHAAETITETYAGGLDIAAHDHTSVDMCEVYARSRGRLLHTTAQRFQGQVIIDAAHGAMGSMASHYPAIDWRRVRALPFFGGDTPDPTLHDTAASVARALVSGAADPAACVVAMVDGDGDRLVLYSDMSGIINSTEQAALLIASNPGIERLLTTYVAPRALLAAAARAGVAIHIGPVGFKNISSRRSPGETALGVEPNGAFALIDDPADDYFERDSLRSLATILRAFPGAAALDEAVARLRREHPHPQQIVNSRLDSSEVLRRLAGVVRGWTRWHQGDVVGFADDPRCVIVRSSGTEELTRLYAELPLGELDSLRERVAAC